MPATNFDANARTAAFRKPNAKRRIDVDDAGAVIDAEPRVTDQRSLAEDVGPCAAVDVAWNENRVNKILYETGPGNDKPKLE